MQSIYLLLALLQPAPTLTGPNGFDFFLGRWQAEQRWLQEDMTYQESTNRVHVFKTLRGHGIQDDNFKPTGDGETYVGSAMRVFDTKNQRWICRWFDGRKKELSDDFFLSADKDGFSGVTEGRDHHGAFRAHIRFHSITQHKIQWQMVRRYEGLDRDLLIGEITYTRLEENTK